MKIYYIIIQHFKSNCNFKNYYADHSLAPCLCRNTHSNFACFILLRLAQIMIPESRPPVNETMRKAAVPEKDKIQKRRLKYAYRRF
jgi:hypothetical protein